MQSSRKASYQVTLVPPVLESVKTKDSTKKWETKEEMECADSKESTGSQEPLSPAARLFHAPRFNCTILTAIGCKTSINPGVIKMGLEQTLMKHPRFSKKVTLADLMANESNNPRWGWGNRIGYIILPFTIGLQDDPLEHIRKAKAMIDRKKLSLEATFSFHGAMLVIKLFGAKASASMARRVLSNTTLAFSNVVGPVEEISFYGHPVAYIAPSVYGSPHALTIHFQSYGSKMTVVVAVDPDVIPDPHELCDDLEKSLEIIKDAAVMI